MGMLLERNAAVAAVLAVALLPVASTPGREWTARPPAADRAGAYLLVARSPSRGYAPPFTGNGYLGIRVPADGQGYAAGPTPADATLAGFYAKPSGQVQQRANLPDWSALTLTVGGRSFSATAGQVTNWRQQLDLRDGLITTSAVWTAPNGDVTGLRYQVLTDRACAHVALVRLTLTPRWRGTATVTDLMDGTPATLTQARLAGWRSGRRQDWQAVRAVGTGLSAALASQVRLSRDVRGATDSPVASGTAVATAAAQTVGQRLDFPVASGHSYTVTKYLGIVTGTAPAAAAAAARRQARTAAAAGFMRILARDTAAWGSLWRRRVDVLGNPALATEVDASEFYLWASARAGEDWSMSPAGLSSNADNGHVFWDAETWMYPALLAQHPRLAATVNAYRYQRLGAAEAHARATGYRGARFPWGSALDGTEQSSPPASVNGEGRYGQDVTADVALAQWQYYLASGDRGWLARRGWPVLSQAARFWGSRVVRGRGGAYHIPPATGPGEGNAAVNDKMYTNAAAAQTLRIAAAAARALGHHAPASWRRIARGLALPAGGRHHLPRTDPDGPSTSDAVNSIDASALGPPGCAAYVYTQRSVQPFIRDAFDQFSQTGSGGALTSTTGIGGFLQEFLYGYSGLRWSAGSVRLRPSLGGGLSGVVLRGLIWHGRVFTVAIGPTVTTVRRESGPPLPVTAAGRTRLVRTQLRLRTRRPDRAPTTDLTRCQVVAASSAEPGAIPLAAVDGSAATGWQPRRVPARLTVRLARAAVIRTATLVWGRAWPLSPVPGGRPPDGPARVLRASGYELATSRNGRTWTPVARVAGVSSGVRDVLSFAPVRARYVRLRLISAPRQVLPQLDELVIPAG